ncbi:FimD/PapC C-terminal domain-containing protein [Enterobacter chuandaensis]|uniref:FimD/PapC C-terminal domain-containing protein n=1 Tax=Enterobacter chuandaensis TaxID=2497875 RepID=UPI0039C420C1
MSVDVEETRKHIVPTAGAAVHIKIETQQHQQTFVRFIHASGKEIPFGAQVTDAGNNTLGMVGQSGLAMVTLSDAKTPLTITWNKNKVMNSCTADVNNAPENLNAHNSKNGTALNALAITCKGL